MNERVKSSSRVRLPPKMSGERATAQSVNSVRCSSGVSRDCRTSPHPGWGRASLRAACRHRASCQGPYRGTIQPDDRRHPSNPKGNSPVRACGEGPSIPVIVGDAPHLRVLRDLGSVAEIRGSGREAQHDRPPGLADGIGDLANLRGAIRMIGDAIDLEEIHAPSA